MRELTVEETEMVNGGVGPGGAIIGAAIGVGTSIALDKSIGETIASGLIGGVSGFFGGIATSRYASSATRYMFGGYSAGTGVVGGVVGADS